MANLTLVQAINLALVQEMEKDDRIILLGEDVGHNGGVFRVTEGLAKRFGEHRVVDRHEVLLSWIGAAVNVCDELGEGPDALALESLVLRGEVAVHLGVPWQMPAGVTEEVAGEEVLRIAAGARSHREHDE